MMNRIGSLKIANRRSHIRAMSVTYGGHWDFADEKKRKKTENTKKMGQNIMPAGVKNISRRGAYKPGQPLKLGGINLQGDVKLQGGYQTSQSARNELFKAASQMTPSWCFPEDTTDLELNLEDRCNNYQTYRDSDIWDGPPKFAGKRAKIAEIIPLNAIDHLEIPKYPDFPVNYRNNIKQLLTTKQLDTLQEIYKTIYTAEQYEYQHEVDDVSTGDAIYKDGPYTGYILWQNWTGNNFFWKC